MAKVTSQYVHRVDTYDYDERISALWKGYIVDFKKDEYDRLVATGMEGLEVITEKEMFGIGPCVTVKIKEEKSYWEDLFQ